jgi:hypothetical protein
MACLAELEKVYSQNPVLITYEWLEQATRIVRRALAGGGEDRSLYNDICKRINKSTGLTLSGRHEIKAVIRSRFLFDEGLSFYIRGDIGDSKEPNDHERDMVVSKLITDVLNGYSQEPHHSWKYNCILQGKQYVA